MNDVFDSTNLLSYIFQWIAKPSDFAAVARCCKRWRAIITRNRDRFVRQVYAYYGSSRIDHIRLFDNCAEAFNYMYNSLIKARNTDYVWHIEIGRIWLGSQKGRDICERIRDLTKQVEDGKCVSIMVPMDIIRDMPLTPRTCYIAKFSCNLRDSFYMSPDDCTDSWHFEYFDEHGPDTGRCISDRSWPVGQSGDMVEDANGRIRFSRTPYEIPYHLMPRNMLDGNPPAPRLAFVIIEYANRPQFDVRRIRSKTDDSFITTVSDEFKPPRKFLGYRGEYVSWAGGAYKADAALNKRQWLCKSIDSIKK